MSIAIKVEKLSKAYQIGQIGTGTISRDIERWFVTKVIGREDPFLKLGQVNDRTTKGDTNVVWSLKDINLEIEQGDAVGIIGRNGAGKSTLLKLLSRVTSPTTGSIKIRGRVASLLEVGTGFHQELTGRENIYLNGTILGMRKKEIDRKFDEIVDFSGVERYIDTPVKRYSSGMSVRLAFAVAAHLDSEILIVDEVLAVGDAEFQKKCLGKMEEVGRKEGRTVLFVSHNMSAVQELCHTGIQIDNGQIAFQGPVGACVAKYHSFDGPEIPSPATGLDPVRLGIVKINGSACPKIQSGEAMNFTLDLNTRDLRNPRIFFIIEKVHGQSIVHESIQSRDIGAHTMNGDYRLTMDLPPLWLAPGIYSVYAKFIMTGALKSKIHSDRVLLEITGDFDKTGKALLKPEARWRVTSMTHLKNITVNV